MAASRRKIVLGLGSAAVAALAGGWGCRSMPPSSSVCPQVAGKKIRWIVPHSAGGGFDTESRLIEPIYGEKLGAEIVVENMPGAGGIVGAKAIMNARPDGLTMGIMSVPGLMGAALTGETEAPNPAADFTILGRVSRSWQVWAVGADSPFRTIEDLLTESKKRPIVFAVTDVGSTSFITITVSALLLGVEIEFAAGFPGMRDASLAALRGDVDCVCFNFETILNLVENGDLRPLLQISNKRISQHPSLAGVPLLGGSNGLAGERAKKLGQDEGKAAETAENLIGFIGSGRIIAAPRGLEEGLFKCLERSLYETLSRQAFQAGAQNAPDAAGGDQTRRDIESAVGKAKSLLPIIQEAVKKTRG